MFGNRFKCTTCQTNKNMMRVWGCEEKCQTSESVFDEEENGIHYRYWNCPIKFIPNNLVEFTSMMWYSGKFQGAAMPEYKGVSVRFKKAVQYYDSHYNEYLRKRVRNG